MMFLLEFRFLLTTLVFLSIIGPVYADNQVPDRIVQAAYCDGVLIGQLNFLKEASSSCASTDHDQCEKSYQSAQILMGKYQYRILIIENYLDLYKTQSINISNALMNFTLIGEKDYQNYGQELRQCSVSADKFSKCTDDTQIKYAKVSKCSNFDPLDFQK